LEPPRILAKFLGICCAKWRHDSACEPPAGATCRHFAAEEDSDELVGTTAAAKSALGKSLANWRSLIDNVVESREQRAERERGQGRLFE
jgi:hypothetical protein